MSDSPQGCIVRIGDTRNTGNGVLDCRRNATRSRACERGSAYCPRVALGTLDALLDQLRPPSVDVVKLDVEGHECAVLQGGESLFARYRPRFVQLEGKSRRTRQCAQEFANRFGYAVGTRRGVDKNFVLFDTRLRSPALVGRQLLGRRAI